jgi:hypothetical protein
MYIDDGYSWTLDDSDPMIIVIKQHGSTIMRIFLGEAMESAGRARVMSHVRECDRSPWLKQWREHAEREMIENLSK